jgi:hypothetical protein
MTTKKKDTTFDFHVILHGMLSVTAPNLKTALRRSRAGVIRMLGYEGLKAVPLKANKAEHWAFISYDPKNERGLYVSLPKEGMLVRAPRIPKRPPA